MKFSKLILSTLVLGSAAFLAACDKAPEEKQAPAAQSEAPAAAEQAKTDDQAKTEEKADTKADAKADVKEEAKDTAKDVGMTSDEVYVQKFDSTTAYIDHISGKANFNDALPLAGRYNNVINYFSRAQTALDNTKDEDKAEATKQLLSLIYLNFLEVNDYYKQHKDDADVKALFKKN